MFPMTLIMVIMIVSILYLFYYCNRNIIDCIRNDRKFNIVVHNQYNSIIEVVLTYDTDKLYYWFLSKNNLLLISKTFRTSDDAIAFLEELKRDNTIIDFYPLE